MITTALHFASVALNTDPVPKPIELTASQKYSILAEQGRHGQRIKSWVKKNYLFSYQMFERNSWEPCPIKPSHLRKWQHRIKKNGGLSVNGVRINTRKEYSQQLAITFALHLCFTSNNNYSTFSIYLFIAFLIEVFHVYEVYFSLLYNTLK